MSNFVVLMSDEHNPFDSEPHGHRSVRTPLQQLPEDDPDRVVFSEYHGHGAPGSSYMIRKGRWKYIHYTGAPAQLFDLATDPDELHNLAADEPAIVADLHAELECICSPQKENDRAEAFIEAQLEAIETGPPPCSPGSNIL